MIREATARDDAEALISEAVQEIIRVAMRQGLTQRELARLSGVSKRSIERLLGGSSLGMRTTNLCKLVRALGYTMHVSFSPLDKQRG